MSLLPSATKKRKEQRPTLAGRGHSVLAKVIRRRSNRLWRHEGKCCLRNLLRREDLTSPVKFKAVGRRALKGVFFKKKVRKSDPLLAVAA